MDDHLDHLNDQAFAIVKPIVMKLQFAIAQAPSSPDLYAACMVHLARSALICLFAQSEPEKIVDSFDLGHDIVLEAWRTAQEARQAKAESQ